MKPKLRRIHQIINSFRVTGQFIWIFLPSLTYRRPLYERRLGTTNLNAYKMYRETFKALKKRNLEYIIFRIHIKRTPLRLNVF